MSKLSFETWILLKEWADFGFDKKVGELKRDEIGGTVPHEGADPINPINSELIIDELFRLPAIGVFYPKSKMSNILEWGNGVGSLQICISPLGSYKAIIRKLTNDLQGESIWVCKDVVVFNENEHNNNEIPLAQEIHESLNILAHEELDSPKMEYKDFKKLAFKIFDEVKRKYPAYCMFPIGIKKMHEEYYKIIFEFRGHGVEAPTKGRAEQFNIDIFWDKQKGLTRCWGYDIDSKMRQHTWAVQPSEFDEWFAPNQDIKKTTEIIRKILMTY